MKDTGRHSVASVIECLLFMIDYTNKKQENIVSDISDRDIKVSVIVICYNQEKSIARTLDSVIAQKTDFPIEIIIGEDNSADNTPQICREYADKYPDMIRLFLNKENKGLLHNYYDCVLAARGKYIADLGGDDFWTDPSKLQIEAETLDRYPDVSLVHTDWEYYEEHSRSFRSPWKAGVYPYLDSFAMEYPPLTLLKHLNPNPVHLCSAMYRRNLFLQLYEEDEFLFRNKQFIVEDLQLIVMLATLGRFIFINRKTLAYSHNSDSLTGNQDFRRQFDLYLASMNLTRYLENKIEIDHLQILPVYKKFGHYLAMQAFHAEDKERMTRLKMAIPEWKVKPSKKTSIILGISKSSILWRTTLFFWKLYRKIKIQNNQRP